MKTNLLPEYYVRPGIFDSERQRLFSSTWQLLGPASRLVDQGNYVSDDIAGMKVLVLRDQQGVLRGYRNVCRHRGAQLISQGSGNCRTIRCPYHNWSYALSGELKHAPWFGDDPDFNLEHWALEEIKVEQWRGLVFVAINPVNTLLKQLGDTIAELADVPMEDYLFHQEHRLTFDSNWKIYTDNFVEGYHIPGIHPEFFAAIDFEQFETTAHAGLVKMTAPANKDLFYKGRWYWMWPNWTLSLFSGGINTSRINPLSHDKTELVYHFYFEQDGVSVADRSDTIARNLEVIRQDFQVCLETHNNYATGSYQPGPLSPRHEQGVAYFQEKYRALISSDQVA